jgi:hypothetical protein
LRNPKPPAKRADRVASGASSAKLLAFDARLVGVPQALLEALWE